ncbi:MAG: hypothetical protein ACP5DZ_11505, partial [Bacteroidales bacterium]
MENIFNTSLLTEIVDNLKNWLTTEFPGLLLIIVLFFFLLMIVKYFFRKLRKSLLTRAEKNSNVDTNEASKRVDTLINISHA